MPVVTVPQDNYRNDQINQGIQNMLGGLETLEKSKQAEELQRRQQAFQALEMQTKAREQGYDVGLDPYLKAAQSGDISGISEALKTAGRTPEYIARQKKEALELKKLEGQVKKLGMGGKEDGGGEKIPASRIAMLSEGQNIPNMLQDLSKTLETSSDVMGPISGRLRSLNPYDERVKTIQAQSEAAAQIVGKFLEGGVLRKEDMPKYQRMLPQLSDTPEVAKNKLAIVQREISRRQQNTMDALKKSGYDVSGFEQLNVPNLPKALTNQGAQVANQGQVAPGMSNAYAAPVPDLTKMSREEKLRLIRGR